MGIYGPAIPTPSPGLKKASTTEATEATESEIATGDVKSGTAQSIGTGRGRSSGRLARLLLPVRRSAPSSGCNSGERHHVTGGKMPTFLYRCYGDALNSTTTDSAVLQPFEHDLNFGLKHLPSIPGEAELIFRPSILPAKQIGEIVRKWNKAPISPRARTTLAIVATIDCCITALDFTDPTFQVTMWTSYSHRDEVCIRYHAGLIRL
ncbi:unnamed protein product [Protopolystoma xenopodis]|uniref:Uncharacterized protein n=1 Tax=Protopolystoma xenopodis TaxID=117903 RepID=A0A448XH47_9PLAT|nr:unnamed protein product [Protopolystoma xenopodis]